MLETTIPYTINSIEDAQAIFDNLESASLDFMYGRWYGWECLTGHPMEGMLEASGWYGKWFEDAENVHPLLLLTSNKKSLYAVNPALVFVFTRLNLPLGLIKLLSGLAKPFIQTRRSRARLRMTEYKGKLSATMCYDQLPIHDIFRKVDNQTVMGLMDNKADQQAYFFFLRKANDNLEVKGLR